MLTVMATNDDVTVKQEPVEAVDLENRFESLPICQNQMITKGYSWFPYCFQVSQQTVFLSFNIFRIIGLCQEIPKGITDQVIQNDMPQFDARQRVTAINRLLSTVF